MLPYLSSVLFGTFSAVGDVVLMHECVRDQEQHVRACMHNGQGGENSKKQTLSLFDLV